MARKPKTLIGWEEWCALPELGLPCIKAKVDTGAKTSALHAYDIKAFKKDGVSWVRFKVHPLQRNQKNVVECVSPLKDLRTVISSNGEKEKRYVIETKMIINDTKLVTELTLTSRHKMAFRMLLGREALRRARFIVDPAKSHITGKIKDPQLLYLTPPDEGTGENV